jgi:hypothetical protein
MVSFTVNNVLNAKLTLRSDYNSQKIIRQKLLLKGEFVFQSRKFIVLYEIILGVFDLYGKMRCLLS